MSTGGGWQDQVGGVTPGIKFITTKPGIDQKIQVEHVELESETLQELEERFVLSSKLNAASSVTLKQVFYSA